MFQHGCLNCVLFVRRDIWTLIFRLDFFLLWKFSDSERKFPVRFIEKCQQFVKSTIFVYWGKSWRFWISEKFWRHFLLFFWNCFELWEEILSKLYFTYPEEQIDFFVGICSWLKFSELRLNEVTLLAQKFNRFSKLQTTCLEEVWLYFVVLIGFFAFRNFCDF